MKLQGPSAPPAGFAGGPWPSPPPTAEGSGSRVGGHEWLALPEFGIACIQARLDPAGDESTLDASNVVVHQDGTARLARFQIHPIAGDERTVVIAEAPLAERSAVATEPVIHTLVTLGEEIWPIELRLVRHHPWRCRLRLGRTALAHRVTVDPNRSFLAGPPRPR